MPAHGREVHNVPNKARYACERSRESEAAVSCERPVSYKAGGLFQHPARFYREADREG